jgi:hypothetical protein
MKTKTLYAVKGQATGYAISSMLTLIIGSSIATFIVILMGVLSGQTYNISQTQIAAITDPNISAAVTSGITNAFTAQTQVTQYLPLIILAVVAGIVLAVVMGIGAFASVGGGHMGGSAL